MPSYTRRPAHTFDGSDLLAVDQESLLQILGSWA